MKKLTVFGASEHIGKLLAELALQNGFEMKAFGRPSANSDLQPLDLQAII